MDALLNNKFTTQSKTQERNIKVMWLAWKTNSLFVASICTGIQQLIQIIDSTVKIGCNFDTPSLQLYN